MPRAIVRAASCLVLLALACGDDGDVSSGLTSASATISGGSGGSDSTDGTGATDGSGTSSTSGQPTTGDSDSGTTGDPSTGTTSSGTSGDPTTGTSGTSGPICDPGDLNCVCDGGACQPGLTCEGGVCVPEDMCAGDLGEPDDDEPNAQDLGEITDDDDETLMANGVLAGVGDVDWYTYHGLDTILHVAEPTVQITSGDAVRLCQFLECDEGGPVMTEVTCPANTQQALSGQLRPGCCGIASFQITDFNCPGSSDDIRVYIRIDMPDSDACIDYGIVIHN